MIDLSGSQQHQNTLSALTETLIGNLYGSDLEWVQNGTLIGAKSPPLPPKVPRNLSHQRGVHWPVPPLSQR